MKRSRHMVLDRAVIDECFEYTVFRIPALMKRELVSVLPAIKPLLENPDAELFVVPTFQKSETDLVDWGEQAANSKDRLLETFAAWAALVRENVLANEPAAWFDAIDPVTGFPWNSQRGSAVYAEVDGAEQLCKYSVNSSCAAGCRMCVHPVWKTAVYPATCFAACSLPVLEQAIEVANRVIFKCMSRSPGAGTDARESEMNT
eukprot:ANDGO_03841.mRNA.1 hypothetical protein PHYSODRAFT_314054